MTSPKCVVIGTGRLAGGFIAPRLSAAGWSCVLGGRGRAVVDAIAEGGGLWLRTGGADTSQQWVGGVTALAVDDRSLRAAVCQADLLATAVGPTALDSVGRMLAPLVRSRLETTRAPINIITFENHRRAAEMLIRGMLEAEPSLAREVGSRVGIGGAAVWRAISKREVTPEGVRYQADDVDECYVDAASLVHPAPPLDGSAPGLELVRSFDDRMVEKLWLFNVGHAAAAYLGWQAGCSTLSAAMERADIRERVSAVVEEAGQAFEARLSARPTSVQIPSRPLGWILERYSDPRLDDPVTRVAREPRRKLAPDDRLIGPATQCLSVGLRPTALAAAAAAALAYGEPSEVQAVDLQRELELVGPEEVLTTVSMLDPNEELTRLICALYRASYGIGGTS